MGEFAQTVSNRAPSDLEKSLSHSLGALAELECKAQEQKTLSVVIWTLHFSLSYYPYSIPNPPCLILNCTCADSPVPYEAMLNLALKAVR